MLTFRLKYSSVLGWSRSEYNDLVRKVYRVGLEYWHREYRAKRFTHPGAREYGFRPRQGEKGNMTNKKGVRLPFRRTYTGQKLRKYGHTRPLELTGESKNNTRLRDIRVTSKGGKVVMNAPKLNFSRVEATAVSQAEIKQMQRVMDRYMDSQLRNEKGIRREDIK